MNTIQFKKVRILIACIILFLLLVLLIKFCSQRFSEALHHRNARNWENHNLLPSTPVHEPPPEENKGAYILKKKRPGDMGKPVQLTAEEQAKAKELWSLNEFNMVASEKMPLDRTLPDFRHSMCLDMDYNVSSLPITSIIVIFHNEEFNTVLRTATSCYNRSPPHLLKEIVLVDDFSDREHLKGPLDEYVNSHFEGKVRVVRTSSRHGLIRAKNFGSTHATGDALIFLDSHCECTEGWLPPLLAALRDNPKTVVQPVIPGIDQNTLALESSQRSLASQGTFEWTMLFFWRSIPEHDQKLRHTPIDRIRSPTLAGGLFGLMRNWWEYLGRYDDGMELWGGENLELSFKTWLCGGMVEYIPCSHVGHIYRGKHPYRWYKPGPDRAFTVNARRLAEVWLDDYKKFFYAVAPDAKTLDMGDISEQLANKKRLNCKPFKYFITDVVKDMYPPTIKDRAAGSLKLDSQNLCLDTFNEKRGPIKLFSCHGMGGNQAGSLSEIGEIRLHTTVCLQSVTSNSIVVMAMCDGKDKQMWDHTEKGSKIIHRLTNQCMTKVDQSVKVIECSDSDPNQLWSFDNYYDPPQ